MDVLDALEAGIAAAPDGGLASNSAIELVWCGLSPEAASREGIDRLNALLAWLDRVESWPELRTALEELYETDEAVGRDRRALLSTWARFPASHTPVPDELLPGRSEVEQELAELIRAERTAAVARTGRAADGYLCVFDALLIGLERLDDAGLERPADGSAVVATLTYLAAHPTVPAGHGLPAEDIDAWRRACDANPELARAFRLAEKLLRRSPDDRGWLLAVLGSGFAWLPLPA